MEQHILANKIQEKIGNRRVLAAIFHTFNFDPRFFENYVMPLLIKDTHFSDEIIYNKILWRNCQKEGQIPPVAVFCDFFAKDNTEAPSLGYDIFCIKTPSAKGHICHFHPKQIFILLESNDKEARQSLLMITGSGNITPSGWCENFEGFSFQEVWKNKTHPNRTSTNVIQDIFNEINTLTRQKENAEAIQKIDDFLKYVDFNILYFNSLSESCKDFLDKNIFNKEIITEMEIISPYFSNDTSLIQYLTKEKGIKNIRCLIPTLRNNEIQLEKEAFLRFEAAGLVWSFWEKYKGFDRNQEVRNLHTKIYRFYGKKNSYTLIGSVNFTNPAWRHFNQTHNTANIESAILYVENKDIAHLLKPATNFNINNFHFIAKENIENPKEDEKVNRDAPEIDFTIDWQTKKLRVIATHKIVNCNFENILKGVSVKKGIFDLAKSDIDALAKSTLIRIQQCLAKGEYIYTYYPKQLNIEMKPLDFKLSALQILQYWDFLSDSYEKETLTRILAESATDASGMVDEHKLISQSLLNEMAAHFSGITKLGQFLFPLVIHTQKERKEHFKKMKYYLLSENIDTLPYYFNDVKRQTDDNKLQHSFCWMVLQIIRLNFYEKSKKWRYAKEIGEEWQGFKKQVELKIEELKTLSVQEMAQIKCSDNQQQWLITQLQKEYEHLKQ